MAFETIDQVVKAKSENSSINYKLVGHSVEISRICSHTFLTKVSWKQDIYLRPHKQSVCLVLPSIRIWNSNPKRGYQKIRENTFYHQNYVENAKIL